MGNVDWRARHKLPIGDDLRRNEYRVRVYSRWIPMGFITVQFIKSCVGDRVVEDDSVSRQVARGIDVRYHACGYTGRSEILEEADAAKCVIPESKVDAIV